MAIVIKSKARVFGDSINSQELLEAIKSPVFKMDAPIQISTRYYTGLLKMIYRCKHCHKLHFVCGTFEEEEYLEAIIQLEIHANHNKDGEFVTKQELIEVLEALEENTEISLEDTVDTCTYTLTKIFKCSENCPVIHLDCAYEKDSPHLN